MQTGNGLKAVESVQRLSGRIPLWAQCLIIVYAVHAAFLVTFGELFVVIRKAYDIGQLQFVRPVKILPNSVTLGWDSAPYQELMQSYVHNVWPPLYPMMLRAASWLVPGDGPVFAAAAQLVGFASHIAIAVGLTRYGSKLRLSREQIRAAVLFVFFFPGHNVMFAAYSEPLYIALSVWCFVALRAERFLWVALLGSLAVLTRNMGLFLAVALLSAPILIHLQRRGQPLAERFFSMRSLSEFSAALGRLWPVALPLFVGLAWYFGSASYFGQTPDQAADGWARDLLLHHVPQGVSARLWVLEYLAYKGPPGTVLLFYATLISILLLIQKKLYVEATYLLAFFVSFAFYLYRPFPFPRYVSVFFPSVFVVVSLFRPGWLLGLSVTLSVIYSEFMHAVLFSGWAGEP